jgi:hypothetical protein
MRMILGLSALALTAIAVPALAQPQYGAPRGSYERQCTNIQMNGQFLSAVCRGARGGGQSSINVASCSSDIGVDASGALSCVGPGAEVAPPPPPPVRARPGYDAGPAYSGRDRGRGGYGYGRDSISLFAGRNFRGEPVQIAGPTPNLAGLGLNDRVRSIELDRRSGPWIVCTDADYRGRCVTVTGSVADVRQIGMRDAVSSLRPAR